MAIYKYKQFIEQEDNSAFDALIQPDNRAPWPGIYRCHVCGREIAVAAGNILPQESHPQHKPRKEPIQWQLIVSHH